MSPRDSSELSAYLRRQREAAGLSQHELAKRSGVTRTTIGQLELGVIGSPDPHKLQLLARALDVDAEDLFALADYTSPRGLPAFGPYLRARYGSSLSNEARQRLEEYFEMVSERYGDSDGEPNR
jgi:transcriptional regulator with XRE-family HTH domain